jgi:hypothetical protein
MSHTRPYTMHGSAYGPRGRYGGQGESVETRIGKRIQPQPNGCWLYRGDPDTYAKTALARGWPITVHRFVYETLLDVEIPEGHDLHHLCETPGCCNPDHLEPLTRKEHKAEHKRLRDAG